MPARPSALTSARCCYAPPPRGRPRASGTPPAASRDTVISLFHVVVSASELQTISGSDSRTRERDVTEASPTSRSMQPRDLAVRRAGGERDSWTRNPSKLLVVGFLVAVGVCLCVVRAENTSIRARLARYKFELALAQNSITRLSREVVVANAAPPIDGVQQPAPATAAATLPADAPDVPPAGSPATAVSDSIEQPLPECSVVFFHHIEKTAGTTLRSILQRNAQLGHFDFFSFINRYNKLQFQAITHRLDTLVAQGSAGLKGLRLAVEIHIGGGGYEHFIKYTMPDLLLLRKKLRGAGCRCNLVTLLRHPLTAHLSWHHHFVNQRVPLCFWNSPYDCQARMSIALACHGGPSVRPLTADHQAAITQMWSSFDLVGVTEFFDEFVVLLAELVGLPTIAYRSQLATKKTTEARVLAQQWTRRSCAALTAEPPDALIDYIRRRMDTSAAAAAENMRRRGRGDSRGPPGMMDCAGYGPCDVPGVPEGSAQKEYRWYDAQQCAAVTPQQVLRRLCARMATDEPLYNAARAKFDERLAAAAPPLAAKVSKLRAAGAELSRRADEQGALPTATLERQSGVTLSRAYRQASGGGDRPPAPWVVDEFAPWYKPHERARYSCANCSGDVVPEFDLVGCWPLWPQFGPDELRFRCTRRWSVDPGMNHPRDFMVRGSREALPCWQTCWTPFGGTPGDAPHCTAPCPKAGEAEAAVAWRERWDRELAAFVTEPGEALELRRLTEFIRPLPSTNFMWGVF